MEQKKSKAPIGMQLICLLFNVEILRHFFITIIAVFTKVCGKDITLTTPDKKCEMFSEMPIVNGIVVMALLALASLAIMRRFKWGWYFILMFTGYGLVKKAIELFSILKSSYSSVILVSVILVIIVEVVIAVYIFRKRSYFHA